MNLDQLRKELEIDEGKKNYIYLDHLGYPTFGIGHLVRVNDPEHGKPIGTYVTEERIIKVFEEDIKQVLKDCEKLYNPYFYDLPEEAQLILANMMFNLGYTRLSKFKNMKKAIDKKDWKQAAVEMKDSRWYKQVTNRATRLINRMKTI